MRYQSSCIFKAVVLTLLFLSSSIAQTVLRVKEDSTRIQLLSNDAAVDLPIENQTRDTISAYILLELVDPAGKVRAHSEQDAPLPPGVTKLKATLPLASSLIDKVDGKNLLWYRLRYTITQNPPASSLPAPLVGVLSVGEATPGIFELHVAAPEIVRESGHYAIRVRAIHPVTGRPVAGVAVQASLDTDDDKPLLTRTAATDRRGFATLPFALPQIVETDEVIVKVTGKLANYSAEANDDFQVAHYSTVSVSTDKPIYQPGQALHMRLMAFDTNKKAIAGEPVILKLLDPEDTLVYRAQVETSAFGIASTDWQIPDSLRLGTYRIQAIFGEGRYADSGASATVKISRYDLPTFTVTANPDRAFYLPDQNASIEIHADYLFGEPVRHGHVRVVRETERKWNYREQKWETEEDETYEGDTDDHGRYVAKVDLAGDHDDLAEQDYSRFHDLKLAAYYTDSSTGRTEQRRFDLRITKDPIHIYVIGAAGSLPSGLPLEFYLSTSYADGSPASCDVEISWADDQPAPENAVSGEPVEQFLRRVHTNRYGVAKVAGLTTPGLTGPAHSGSSNFELSFRAKDSKGAVGRHIEAMWFYDRPGIRVATDKTLYKPGEPVQVRLTTAEPDLTLVLDAVRDFQIIASKQVHVRHHSAEVVFDSADKFENEITILAYTFGRKPGDDYYNSAITDSHTIAFPKNHELQVEVKLAKSVYHPGDEATANLQVTSPSGEPAKSALGLVVVDQAVEERERADSDFRGQGGFFNFRDDSDGTSGLGGIRRSDLDKLDLSKPLPDGLELVAEILLQGNTLRPKTFASVSDPVDLAKLFASEFNPQIDPIRTALESRYAQKSEYPKTEAALEIFSADAGSSWRDAKDPWGRPYHATFSVARESDILEISSAGPDKILGTEDDFVVARMSWPYFKLYSDAIQRSVDEFHVRTGAFLRDEQSLKTELTRLGIDFDSLKDRWGHAYQLSFGVNRTHFTVTVTSAGPDGRFTSKQSPSEDDFPLATVGIDYFADTRAQIDAALTANFKQSQSFPENPDQLKAALDRSGISWGALRDPWGHPYYATFRTEARFSDDLNVETYEHHTQNERQHATIVPVTQRINWVQIRSAGEDGLEGTSDDFDVASFSRGVLEQSSKDKTPVPISNAAVLQGSSGAISGTVTDPMGGAVASAEISAKNSATAANFTTNTGENGDYLLRNLPAGFYVVQFSAKGFRSYSITNVPVRSSNVTNLDALLSVGAVTETVEVSAEAVQLQTSQNAMLVTQQSLSSLPLQSRLQTQLQLATPRLREYFPETLLWRPEVLTDDKGRAQLKFPLADNITTWKLSAVASTVNGEIGASEKSIRAFQPFFVEHDPPRFLTIGDEIALPVVLRNYLDRRLQVGVEMKPSPWFTLLSSATLKTAIAPQDSAQDIFSFKAVATVKDGKQEVRAIGAEASDAISRSVTVRPNGEKKTTSVSQIFGDTAALDLQVPDSAIPGSLQTNLKIYPNLTAHVLESIEAILERPYGCGEQTISSTYPSVLLLKFAKASPPEKSPLLPRARRYAQLGYERLLSYRSTDGGFSYWGSGKSDFALTVYAIRFLSDAREFVDVDDSIIQQAESFVVSQIQPDGHWAALEWSGNESSPRSVMLTAYIARMLVASKLTADASSGNAQIVKSTSLAVQHALSYLQPHVDALDEPYAIASYALAALGAGDKSAFASSVASLRKLERREGDSSYWSLEVNTPFYGWGRAGRVETTALVLQALTADDSSADSDPLISRGLLFLIRNQDGYGIWYSTQATISVLNAIASLTSRKSDSSGDKITVGSKAEVLVDGKQALSIDLPPPDVLSPPITVDLSKFVLPGTHHIEVRRPSGSSHASVQVLADYYVPWTHGAVESALHQEAKVSDALRITVQFDKLSANVGELVQCNVAAERIGFRGYGMLLAEIGLPPGAEVDRNSLEQAMRSGGLEINQYDVLPDRVIVYLWPRAGGTKFSFTFKPRFGLKALSAPSILYDYYNPDAQAVVEPTPFTVQ
jgi:A-macroglobulin TED domain/Alpha-2-macroglobulin family/Carboxypeptidase regulatory-like domain/MG2 domain/Alpha-2-macroglobulin bait region domain/A-macroglobulin receptor binding domain/Macroglobulin domain MG3/Type II secretion system (T2SS), protein G